MVQNKHAARHLIETDVVHDGTGSPGKAEGQLPPGHIIHTTYLGRYAQLCVRVVITNQHQGILLWLLQG
jgi:hypothetical protein